MTASEIKYVYASDEFSKKIDECLIEMRTQKAGYGGRKFNSRTKTHFQGIIEKLSFNGKEYVIKTPKKMSTQLYIMRVSQFRLLGDWALNYGAAEDRVSCEREKFARLYDIGVAVPPVIHPNRNDVQVTEFIPSTNGKDFWTDTNIPLDTKMEKLIDATNELKKIHTLFGHGDAKVNNIMIGQEGRTYWGDFEYLLTPKLNNITQRARDVILFYFSASQATNAPEACFEAIFKTYNDSTLNSRAKIYANIQRPLYQILTHLMPYSLAKKTRKVLQERT